MLKKIQAMKNKRGFTLVELVVVVAILAICSGMLVGIVAMSIDRYSASTDMEYCKQEAAYIDKYYTRWSGVASEITEEDLNSATFSYSQYKYYMVIDPDTRTIEFRMGLEGNKYQSVIKCEYVKSFSHSIEYLYESSDSSTPDEEKVRNSEYVIVMENEYGTAVEYTYKGSVVLNNDKTDYFSETYDLTAMDKPVCISFKIKSST